MKSRSVKCHLEPRILVKRTFAPEDIDIKVGESNRKTTPELEERVQKEWEKMYSRTKSEGKTIWDGESYRLNNFHVQDDGKLSLNISLIKYSTRAPLNLLTQYTSALGEDYYSKGLGIAGFVETSDGKFVFGIRSGKTFAFNKIDFIGGIVEGIDLNGGEDLASLNYKEIEEEIGIAKEFIDDFIFLGMVLSNTTNVVIATYTKLNIDAEEVQRLFYQSSDEEMFSLDFVEKKDLERYLQKLGGYKNVVYELLEQLDK